MLCLIIRRILHRLLLDGRIQFEFLQLWVDVLEQGLLPFDELLLLVRGLPKRSIMAVIRILSNDGHLQTLIGSELPLLTRV